MASEGAKINGYMEQQDRRRRRKETKGEDEDFQHRLEAGFEMMAEDEIVDPQNENPMLSYPPSEE